MKKIIVLLIFVLILMTGCNQKEGTADVSQDEEVVDYNEFKVIETTGKIANLHESNGKFIVTVLEIGKDGEDKFHIPYSVLVEEEEFRSLKLGQDYPVTLRIPTI